MKKKRKLGRKLLSFLLTLAMVVGLVPGMGLTAYAQDTPTAYISPENSGTVNVVEATQYNENDSWQFTATPAEGYSFNCWSYSDDGSPSTEDANPIKIHKGTFTNYGSFTAVFVKNHDHEFTYNVEGATITATCTAGGCDLPVVDTKHVATLTIAANGGTYDGTTAYGATITDANSIRGDAKVQYQKKTDGSYGTAAETAPTGAGDYKASITLGTATASVEYTIAKADPTANAPTGLTATYGQTLADVSLEGKNPEGNTPGTWAWVNSTQSVGDVVSPAATFKATFTPTSSNYKTVENVNVSVTVSKAANPATVTSTATVTKGGNTVDLAGNVTKNGATGDVSYAISGEANGCTLNGSVLTSGDNTGSVIVNVSVAADDNYNALAATPITVTISDKGTQTITASDVTATFGETGKKVEATTNGKGAISYAVKDGSADYIDVDASTGALTIKKVGTATVVVTAAETGTYAQATKEVTVTINKANAVAATVTANNRTYDGTEKPLINVDDSTLVGGTMYYAVTTENKAPTDENLYTTFIPTAINTGTYYVWYKVTGDADHNDNAAVCVKVVISEEGSGKDDPAPTPDPDAPTPAPTPAEPDGANDWNLFEDASVHYFKVKDASVNGTVENSNEKSKAYYSAKISGSTIAVSVTGDRKAAANKNNTILEFKLSDGSVIEYTLPVCYVKPNFKLNSPSGTVKNGAESVLKLTLLVKGDAKKTVPYDMTDVKVSGDGLGTVTKGADGRIEVKTSSAGKGKITVTKDGWDPSNPVKLSYKVKAVDKDVMALEPEVKNIILNSNAKGQIFTYDVSINNLAPEAGKIEIVDKKDCGLVEASGNKIIVSYKDGVKAGNYTVGIKSGSAIRNLKIKVSDKALADSIKLKVLRPYDVVTRQGMVVSASLKDVGGKIEAVTVAEEGFSVRLNGEDTFFIDYSGTKYDMKNLDMGTLNLGIKINGINEPVKLSLDKLKAKKKAPKALAAAVIIPKDKEFSEGSVIGTANIVSSVKLNTGRSIILEVAKTEIVSEKGVTAKINANDPKLVNITGMEKNSGTVTVKLTYVGGATKTVKIKVRKK